MAVMVTALAGFSLRDSTSFDDWQYSKCALESALQGSARLLPAKHRAWAELW